MKSQYFDCSGYIEHCTAGKTIDTSQEAADLINYLWKCDPCLHDVLKTLKLSRDWVIDITGHDEYTVDEAISVVSDLLARQEPEQQYG